MSPTASALQPHAGPLDDFVQESDKLASTGWGRRATLVSGPDILVAGGDGGIRTLDRALQPYNGLANRRLQPLGHISGQADMPDAGASRKRQISGRSILRSARRSGKALPERQPPRLAGLMGPVMSTNIIVIVSREDVDVVTIAFKR
jgi:hypothetical protein